MNFIWKLIATFFFIGKMPKAPGTWGTLAALPVGWYILDQFGGNGLALAILLALGVGTAAAEYHAKNIHKADPKEVVIDEVAGMWIALLPAWLDYTSFAVAFIVFRLLDIFKPWPINHLEKIEGGAGIMLDDIFAGVVTAVIVYMIQTFLMWGL